MTYLHSRRGKDRSGTRWYVRVPVPKKLRPIIRKRIIEVALNTDSKKEAQHLRYAVVGEIKKDFDRARGKEITSAHIEKEARAYCEQRLEELQRDPANFNESVQDEFGGFIGLNGDIAIPTIQDLLEDENYPAAIQELAQKTALRRYGVELREGDDQLHEFAMALFRAEYQALARYQAYRDGEDIKPLHTLNPKAVNPVTGKVELPKATEIQTVAGGVTIETASATYIEENTCQPNPIWEDQTRLQNETTLRFFKDYMCDAPLSTVKTRDVAAFAKQLESLNPIYGRKIKGKNTHFLTVLKEYPAQPGEGLNPKTVKRHIGAIPPAFPPRSGPRCRCPRQPCGQP
jgi:hypothetical protein